VSRLARNDLAAIALATDPSFNQFESSGDSTRGLPSSSVVFRNFADAAMRSTIQTELTNLGSALTVDNILDRAMSQTCGGCHRQANNRDLGGGLTFPASNGGFTHVDGFGRVSPAMTNVWLPKRKALLEAFINGRAAGPDTVGITCP
jgi:cytochrome c peroxidase